MTAATRKAAMSCSFVDFFRLIKENLPNSPSELGRLISVRDMLETLYHPDTMSSLKVFLRELRKHEWKMESEKSRDECRLRVAGFLESHEIGLVLNEQPRVPPELLDLDEHMKQHTALRKEACNRLANAILSALSILVEWGMTRIFVIMASHEYWGGPWVAYSDKGVAIRALRRWKKKTQFTSYRFYMTEISMYSELPKKGVRI